MRYELKYYLTEGDYDRFIAVVNEHPAGFVKNYPDRTVNNIYLDSPDLDSWHETQFGLSERKKYRIRWYGDWERMEQPALEIKVKQNQLGTKLVYPLRSLNWDSLSKDIDHIKADLSLPHHLMISSTNFYSRSYFESHCGIYRITIDKELNFGNGLYNLVKPEIPSRWGVMELKYDLTDDQDSDWVKQFIPFQRSKFSKYVNALYLTR